MEMSLYNSNAGNIKQHQITSPTLRQEDDVQLLEDDIDDDNRDDKVDDKEEEAYVKAKQNGFVTKKGGDGDHREQNNKPFDYYLEMASLRSSMENVDQGNELDNVNNARNNPRRLNKINNNESIMSGGSYQRRQSKNFNYSPDTTDYDSESSMRFITSDFQSTQKINTATNVSSTSAAATAMVEMSGGPIISSTSSNSYAKYCTSMPVLEDGLSSGHASDNENNNPIDKRNSSSIASSSTISTIQKQYQETLVQTHANNNIFYSNNNNNNSGMVKSSSINNNSSVLLNNGDLEQKVRSAQSPLSYHPYYAMRYDTTPPSSSSTNAISALKEQSSSTSLRYDSGKEMNSSRYDKESLNTLHGSLLNNNKIFKNRDPELESLYTISEYLHKWGRVQ